MSSTTLKSLKSIIAFTIKAAWIDFFGHLGNENTILAYNHLRRLLVNIHSYLRIQQIWSNIITHSESCFWSCIQCLFSCFGSFWGINLRLSRLVHRLAANRLGLVRLSAHVCCTYSFAPLLIYEILIRAPSSFLKWLSVWADGGWTGVGPFHYTGLSQHLCEEESDKFGSTLRSDKSSSWHIARTISCVVGWRHGWL